MMGEDVVAVNREDAHLADFELDPGKRDLRQKLHQVALAFTDFADQQAMLGQMRRCIAQGAKAHPTAVSHAAVRCVRVEQSALAVFDADDVSSQLRIALFAEANLAHHTVDVGGHQAVANGHQPPET